MLAVRLTAISPKEFKMSQDNVVPLHPALTSGRVIAIAHRVKAKVKDGEAIEAVPTKVMIVNEGKSVNYDLADERAELDFVFGLFPVKWQAFDYDNPDHAEAIAKLASHHVLWKKAGDADSQFLADLPGRLIKREKSGKKEEVFLISKFATQFEGLTAGDTALMVLGGSGDALAYALSRRGEMIDANLYRLSGHALKTARGDKPSDQAERDQSELETLVSFWATAPKSFNLCDAADRQRIRVDICYSAFKEAQAARMACAARLRQQTIGRVFMSDDGLYPEGQIDLWFKQTKGNDVLLDSFITAETRAKAALEKAVQACRVWSVFEPIVGVGPSIAGALIASIGDVRRFANEKMDESKLVAFCGLHALKPDGTKFQPGDTPLGGIMARRRVGQLSNWKPQAKQALYSLGDQFNRRPETPWGKKLLENKASLRITHPEVVLSEKGKKRYTDGHIHKMAIWKTLRQFLRFLCAEWNELESPGWKAKRFELLRVRFEQRQALKAA